jgi:hypothetical protein
MRAGGTTHLILVVQTVVVVDHTLQERSALLVPTSLGSLHQRRRESLVVALALPLLVLLRLDDRSGWIVGLVP